MVHKNLRNPNTCSRCRCCHCRSGRYEENEEFFLRSRAPGSSSIMVSCSTESCRYERCGQVAITMFAGRNCGYFYKTCVYGSVQSDHATEQVCSFVEEQFFYARGNRDEVSECD